MINQHSATTSNLVLLRAVPTVEIIQIEPKNFLADGTLLKKAAVTYREIYGRAEYREGVLIWGEGARDVGNVCNKITLDEFYLREAAGALTAPSGQFYQLCYPNQRMFQKFSAELSEDRQVPFISYIQVSAPEQKSASWDITGLSWGAITDLSRIKAHLTEELVITEELEQDEVEKILSLLKAHGGAEFLYVKEMIIREEFRQGGKYAAQFIKIALEHGARHHNLKFFFWTTVNSLMSFIARAGGLSLIYRAGNYEFFYGSPEVMLELAEDFKKHSAEHVLKKRLLSFSRNQRAALVTPA